MKNKFILASVILSIFSCSTNSIGPKEDNVVDYVAKIENVPIDSQKDNIIKIFGEIKDIASNEKEGFFAFGYPDKKTLRRYIFIFDKKTEKLLSKSVDILEGEPESAINFWKHKYPNSNFKSEAKTTLHGHYWTTEEWISVNKSLTLSISNNKVTQASWSAEKKD